MLHHGGHMRLTDLLLSMEHGRIELGSDWTPSASAASSEEGDATLHSPSRSRSEDGDGGGFETWSGGGGGRISDAAEGRWRDGSEYSPTSGSAEDCSFDLDRASPDEEEGIWYHGAHVGAEQDGDDDQTSLDAQSDERARNKRRHAWVGESHDVNTIDTSSNTSLSQDERDEVEDVTPLQPQAPGSAHLQGAAKTRKHAVAGETPDSSSRDTTPDSNQTQASKAHSGNVATQQDREPDSAHPQSSWKKRRRQGVIPDFRTSSAHKKSALEEVMRRFGDRKTPYVVAPEIGMEFDSLPEAYDFFNLYSWEIGFGIRFGPSRRNANKCKTSQDIVCGCYGKPRHPSTRTVCCGCQAMIRLQRIEDHGWFIQDFRPDHCHGLSVTCGEKMHWASHRSIDPHTKSLVKNLRDNNVGLTKVHCVLGSFFGRMESIPFNKRSLRSLCASISRDHADDDVRKTCELFSELKKEDPNFVDSVLCDSEGKIRALMWTNGKSRMQYKSFGDAITFDTTYRTNQYRMPFGLFVGVNHHFQSIILGGVLMTNETQDTFEWVFKEFWGCPDDDIRRALCSPGNPLPE